MARMTGEVLIHRPLQEVFGFAADLRNEPRFNPRMPSRLGVRSHLTWMDTEGALTFEPVLEGTWLRWDWEVRWRGPVRALA